MPDLPAILTEERLTVEELFCRLLEEEVRERWWRAVQRRAEQGSDDDDWRRLR